MTDLDVPYIDGQFNQEKEYWYKRIIRHVPALRGNPEALYGDNKLLYFRLINEGLIAEVPDYDPESLANYVENALIESYTISDALKKVNLGIDTMRRENGLTRAYTDVEVKRLDQLIDSLEALAGLSAESPIDGQTALLLDDFSSLTRNAAIRTIHDVMNERVGFDVTTFGAIGDKTADDTVAINLAIEKAIARGDGAIIFPPAVGYKVTEPIVIPDGFDVIMKGDLYYAGPSASTALTIGTPTTNNFRRALDIRVSRDNLVYSNSAWADEQEKGVEIYNLYESQVSLTNVFSNTVGAVMSANATGNVYNNIVLGRFFNNRYQLDLYSENGGWTNENVFIGGRFGNQSFRHTMNRHAVRLHAADGYRQNCNIFLKPSFEIAAGVATNSGVPTNPIEIVNGSYNRFENCRSEGSGETIMRTHNDSLDNFVSTTFGNFTYVKDLGRYPSSISRPAAGHNLHGSRVIYDSGHLGKNSVKWNATRTFTKNVMLSGAANNLTFHNVDLVSIVPDGLSVPSTRALSINVSTESAKKFIVRRDIVDNTAGLIGVACFDSAGNQISPVAQGDEYNYHIKGVSTAGFYPVAEFGGVYRTSATDKDVYFQVTDPSVAYVRVYLRASSGSSFTVRGFQIHVVDDYNNSTATCWTDFPEAQDNFLAIEPPTEGTYKVGTRIMHGAPGVGKPQGWVCTAAGTPGTWVPMPNL